MDSKLHLQLKRDDRAMNSWEISAFLNNLAGIYYKSDLINTLNDIYDNINIKDSIFVMDESFNPKNLYSFLNDKALSLENPRNIIRWFHLGNPIPINSSNKELVNINILFSLFKALNTKLGEHKIKKINKEEIKKLFNKTKSDMPYIKKTLKSMCINLANESLNEGSINKATIERLNYDLTSIFDKYNYQNRANFGNKPFFNKLNGLSRPIIGYYSNETKEIKILNPFHINKKAAKNTLDIKKIEHNSPTLFSIFIGTVATGFLIPYCYSIYNNLKDKKTLNETETILMDNFEENYKKLKINKRLKIKENDIKKELTKVTEELNEKATTLFTSNKMKNKDFKIEIITESIVIEKS